MVTALVDRLTFKSYILDMIILLFIVKDYL